LSPAPTAPPIAPPVAASGKRGGKAGRSGMTRTTVRGARCEVRGC
jgi:hypothetical protein